MNIIHNKISRISLSFLFLTVMLFSNTTNAHDHKKNRGYVAGASAGGHMGSRHKDKNYYRKRNRNSVNYGVNYNYPARYRGSYINFNYNYPLSYRRNHKDWRYNNSGNYRRNYNRRHDNSDQLIATAAGVFIGALIGSEIGRYLDDVDRMRARDANLMAHSSPIGQQIKWNNPGSSHYGSTTATRDGYSKSGKYCREFYQTISIGNRTEKAYGTACHQPDGSWQLVQALN